MDRSRTAGAPGRPTLRLITDTAALEQVVDEALGAADYAVDTEFHRERTYFATLALLQLAWDDQIALVDPLAVDVRPLARLFDGPGTAVMHACTQDLEVFQRACGTVPRKLFDTQIAAGFVGFATPSLATLAERVAGIDLPKGSRLTDWLRRPLTEAQLEYAASDVAHLVGIADKLRAALVSAGRLVWAEEECEELRRRDWTGTDPSDAWLRLKEARSLRGRARSVAQEVAAWRERRAMEIDIPVRHVLPDLALVGIATNPPTSIDQLKKLRGVDDRHTRGRPAEELLEAVSRAKELQPSEVRQPKRDDIERDQRPAVTLVSAWLSQLGRQLRIDPSLMATRSDLAAFLAGDDASRLGRGWRRELLGDPVRRLLAGEFALAFDGNGNLALEKRSGEPVIVDLPVPDVPWAK